jgi:hypothetical protein
LTHHARRVKAACVFTVFISIPCHHDDEVEATEVTVRSQTKKMLARDRVLYEDNVCNNTSATRRSVGDWFCKTGKTCVIKSCCANHGGCRTLWRDLAWQCWARNFQPGNGSSVACAWRGCCARKISGKSGTCHWAMPPWFWNRVMRSRLDTSDIIAHPSQYPSLSPTRLPTTIITLKSVQPVAVECVQCFSLWKHWHIDQVHGIHTCGHDNRVSASRTILIGKHGHHRLHRCIEGLASARKFAARPLLWISDTPLSCCIPRIPLCHKRLNSKQSNLTGEVYYLVEFRGGGLLWLKYSRPYFVFEVQYCKDQSLIVDTTVNPPFGQATVWPICQQLNTHKSIVLASNAKRYIVKSVFLT